MARFPYPHIGQITIAKEDGNCSESNIFDLVSQNGLGVTISNVDNELVAHLLLQADEGDQAAITQQV